MIDIDNIPKEAKLILHRRVKPDIYEVHVDRIEQGKNLLFQTSNGEFAERFVTIFNIISRSSIGK
jgi:hypothetical protein